VDEQNDKIEIYSQRVRAGKRTYFFDVKATRTDDYYLTITESKKRFKDDGHFFEKHKIFLYKEDFEKFLEALQQTVEEVKNKLGDKYYESNRPSSGDEESESSDLKWE
jgi:hypothetical protein